MQSYVCTVLVGLLLAASSIQARSAEPSMNTLDDQHQQQQQARAASPAGVFGELRSVYQIYKDCAGSEVSSCLQLKLLTMMERVSRSAKIELTDGISLVKDEPSGGKQPDEEPPKTAQEIESELPRSLEDKEAALSSMIMDRAVGFLQTHTLKLKLPNVEEIQRSLSEEGRGKKRKNMGGLLAIPLLIGGTLVPLALGALALLAGKALIVSKLALVLASIIGLKKLVSGHDHGHEVHGGGGWARSGQELAYSAYKPVVVAPAGAPAAGPSSP